MFRMRCIIRYVLVEMSNWINKKLKVILFRFSIDFDRKSGKVSATSIGNYGEGNGEFPGFVLEY